MTNWRMLGVLIAGVATGSLGPWHGSIKLLGRPLASYRRRELARLVAIGFRP